ncbi:MAG: prolyl oligopeptidase family serine peptidase, partial [Candidatus Eisenbacteria bacterium]
MARSPRIPISLAALLASALVLVSVGAGAADAPPVAQVEDVVDTYWGVPVHDPYRWMEDRKDPRVLAWIRGQADYTASRLDRLQERDALLARIAEFDAGRPWRVLDITPMRGGGLFYLRQEANENLPRLFARPPGGAAERLVFDPAKKPSADGGHFSISWYEPSPDGRRVALGLAPSGSEQDILYVLDVATGQALPDTITRLEAAYTEPQWLPDGSGFFYSRRRDLPADAPETEGYRLTRAYLHRLGAPLENDPLVFAHGLHPNVTMSEEDFPSVVVPAGSGFAIGQIKHGDSNQLTLYAARLDDLTAPAKKGAAAPWRMVCDVPDSVVGYAVHGGTIDLVTSLRAPRFKVVRTGLAAPDFARATTVIAAGVDVVDGVMAAKDALYVQFARGGAGQVARVPYGKAPLPERIALPDSFHSGRLLVADPLIDGVYVATSDWTRAGRTYRYEPAAARFVDTQLNPAGRYDEVPGYASVEVEVTSHDGVKVPLSILYKTDVKRDGSNPTLLSGYGSYGISQNVGFSPTRLAWLERGGVIAIAHVRGGGENGQEWHSAGQKATKPNTWKDFIACAEWLVEQKWTSPRKLAGQGGSAGGILIGRAITERPDLFAAALLDVGALDAVRGETTMNGIPNIMEFGTVKKEDEFHALLAMSAYHHVKDGTAYPAVMLTHGINDPRVDPWMSAKMTARLQAATSSGKPVLFRVDYKAGHGIGSTRTQSQRLLA